MILSEKKLVQLSESAINAALKAGHAIANSDVSNLKVNHKIAGDSAASQVVTEVDLLSQSIILAILEPTCKEFDLALLTEESSDSGERLKKDFFWCIDPLDGTLPFIEQSTGYSISIALVGRSGTPYIGVVYDPVTETLYHAARGQGLYKNRERWNPLASEIKSSKPLTFVCDRSFLKNPEYASTIKTLEAAGDDLGCNGLSLIKHGGAAMNACWVLENAPACYIKYPKPEVGGGSLWDYAATACLFAEAQAVVSDIYGAPLALNNPKTTFMNEHGIIYATDTRLSELFQQSK